MLNIPLFISGSEIFVILFFVFLFFGSKQIPEIARMLGKGMKEIKKATDEIKKEINEADPTKDFRDLNKPQL